MSSLIKRFCMRTIMFFIFGVIIFGSLLIYWSTGNNHESNIIQTRTIAPLALAASLVFGFFSDKIYLMFKKQENKKGEKITKILYIAAFLSGGSLIIWYTCGNYYLNLNSNSGALNLSQRSFEVWQVFFCVFGLFLSGVCINKFLRLIRNVIKSQC